MLNKDRVIINKNNTLLFDSVGMTGVITEVRDPNLYYDNYIVELDGLGKRISLNEKEFDFLDN